MVYEELFDLFVIYKELVFFGKEKNLFLVNMLSIIEKDFFIEIFMGYIFLLGDLRYFDF